MFDLDIGKMVVFAIVALAVIPPKDLPRVLRTVGKYVGQMRRMAADFQGQFMDALKEADVEGVKKEFQSLQSAAKIDSSFDPVMAMRSEMTKAVEGPAAVKTVELPPAAEVAVEEPKLADEPFLKDVVVTPLAVEPAHEPVAVAATEPRPEPPLLETSYLEPPLLETTHPETPHAETPHPESKSAVGAASSSAL